MKFINYFFTFSVILIMMSSCQKDYSIDTINTADGTLTKDTLGNCAPITVAGIYTLNTSLTNSNYIDLKVNFTTIGTYDITSNTVNGYSFHGSGQVATLGNSTIRLTATGTPISTGTNFFTITYGTSSCGINIIVGSTTSITSVFTLSGAPSNCTGATVAGIFTVGTNLAASNTLTVQVNVTVVGSYSISTNIVNGISFSKTGTFTTTGIQNVTLIGSGLPNIAGVNNFTISGAGGCSFAVNVLSGTNATPDVYIAGETGGGATIWKNGVPIIIGAQPDSSYAHSVFLTGNDVYVAVEEGRKAKVWKNGVLTNLNDGVLKAEANSIFVSGNDVYVAGRINSKPCLWKNGVLAPLNLSGYFGSVGRATSVFVVGSDVYVAGYEDETNGYRAKVWKNGVYANVLNTQSDASFAYSVVVVGNDIYVAGEEENYSTGIELGKVWKNGVATTLGLGGSYGFPSVSLFTNGIDVYYAGVDLVGTAAVAKIWKNGIGTNLSNGAISARATSVFVYGTDVYAVGTQGNNLVQWKNGQVSVLNTPPAAGSRGVYSIFVK
jgi:hypothetical protein